MFKLFSKKRKVDLLLKEIATKEFVLNKIDNFKNEKTPIEDLLNPFLNSWYKEIKFEKLTKEEKMKIFSNYVASLTHAQRT